MLSDFGDKFYKPSILRELMNEINSGGKKLLNLSAGNPLVVEEVQDLWNKTAKKMVENGKLGKIISRYGPTKGYKPFLEESVKFFNETRNLNFKTENAIATTGSQTLFFFAVNAFCGPDKNGKRKKLLLPQNPDYIGYNSVIIDEKDTVSLKPDLIIDEENKSYSYKINFDKMPKKEDIGMILFSIPCNPSGNILSEEEILKIYEFVEGTDIPVFIDGAYSKTIPNLAFEDYKIPHHKNAVYTMSFSKAGLPGERVGVAIGDEKFIKVLEGLQANISLMTSFLGQALVSEVLKNGKLQKICENVTGKIYHEKYKLLKKSFHKYINKDLPVYLHKSKGSMFGFVWCKDLPISDKELFDKLREKGVLFLPGFPFFFGNIKNFKHQNECVRISTTAKDDEIKKSMKIFGKVLEEVYRK